jgi:FdrA protein
VSATATRVQRNRYLDSVELMSLTRTMLQSEGVEFASAVMATPANVSALHDQGFAGDELASASANDVILAVRAGDETSATDALGQAERTLSAATAATAEATASPRSLHAALDALDANVAVVSVAGPYAALEAHKALGAGLHVLLFSDNVSVDDEIALKEHAARAGRLVMGPGAGTASLGGCGLGFANSVRSGHVGIVAAAGTGAQEAMVLLDRWGEGVADVIGVGGRDLSEAVAGRGARLAIRALERNPATDVVLLVSKPPSPDVVTAVVSETGAKPLVAALVGLPRGSQIEGVAAVASTIEGGVARVLELRGGRPPSDWSSWRREVERAIAGLPSPRVTVRGLFSGGTLCYEALTLMQPLLGPVRSNAPLDERYGLPAPEGAHVCLDLGEEEYTRGRPHPMIDAEARLEVLAEMGTRDDVAVVLLDVVLGHGSHPDPASVLAPACAALRAADGPRVIVYVLGTDADPQGLTRQQNAFRDASCLIAPTSARAALAAAAIATRAPELVEADVR